MWLLPRPVTAGAVTVTLMLCHQFVAGTTVDVGSGSDRLSSYLADHPIETAVASMFPAPGSGDELVAPELVNVVLKECPAGCDESGEDLNPGNWTLYTKIGRLAMCNETMLLDLNLFNSLRNSETVRACTGPRHNSTTGSTAITSGSDISGTTSTGTITSAGSCFSKDGNWAQAQESVQLAFNETVVPATLEDFEEATEQLADVLSRRETDCTRAGTASFAYTRSVAAGFYAGSGTRGVISASLLQQFVDKVKKDKTGFSGSVVLQLCARDGRGSRYGFGIVASGDGDLVFVQDAVATWASGGCITSHDRAEIWQNVTLSVPKLLAADDLKNGTGDFRLNGTVTSPPLLTSTSAADENALGKRALCRTIQVEQGVFCPALAAQCGVTLANFQKYNPGALFCNTLQAGQHVCCTAGDLPDFRPKPNADGTCASHYVVLGEWCSSLAAANGLTVEEIATFNKNTWGWEGCGNLQAYQYICLSTGAPPMPATVPNAICGPQKPGTSPPVPGTSLATLNPCPLNACCNKHGQCGITKEFCTISKSATGNPGTALPGENGCISNCGTGIIRGTAPAERISIGYFEAYNLDRPCLNMRITSMDMSPYTHIHLAFGHVTTSYAIDVSHIQKQWDLFKGMTGFKKILSLGGWSFSAEPPTYFIFRDAVKPANQARFVANIVSFVLRHNLDGIDIDWEYPAAPDIPGIPPGSAEDAKNYLEFFRKLRAGMPASKSVSFCAPASFWYLRGYHIKDMAALADYIVYMTYDLHGQWDYANRFATEGCPAGNCLRSHVNMTETLLALSMITKAGVPSGKLAVGVTSYGRSFQMTTPGCTGPMCTYTGGDSGAYPGPCTGTAGYISNAEIKAILAGTGSWQTPSGALRHISSYSHYYDSSSLSDVAVYDSTQWVAYMDDKTKTDRTALFKSLAFGGIVDWAIDLQGYGADEIGFGSSSNVVYPPPSIWTSPNPLAGCIPPCIVVWPPYPIRTTHIVRTWPALTTTLLSSRPGGGPGGVEIVTTTIPVPTFTVTAVSFHPLTLQSTDTAEQYKVNPVQSVTPTSFIYTLPPNHATFPASTPTPTTSRDDTDIPIIILPFVTFRSTPVPITIQPQPTYSIKLPDPVVPIPPVTFKPVPTSPPQCSGPGCGVLDCRAFGCGPGCGAFSCGGGCGIFGCGGGCGVFGCKPVCPLAGCGGPGCLIPGGCGNTQGPGGTDSNDSCQKPVTASACTKIVTSYSAWYLPRSTTVTETTCRTSTECNGQDTVTTTTPGSPECTLDSELARLASIAAASEQTVINGQSIPLDFWPTEPPGYDASKFTRTQFGLDKTITVTRTSTQIITPTRTTTIIVQPTVQAKCHRWGVGIWWRFQVWDIDGWATDNGERLKAEAKGCSALTRWQWRQANFQFYSGAFFDLHPFMPAGCVERAIVSAGGPMLQCVERGPSEQIPNKKRSEDHEELAADVAGAQPPAVFSIDDGRALAKRQQTETQTTTYTLPEYTPQSWGPGNTVVFTTTFESVVTTTYTTRFLLGQTATAVDSAVVPSGTSTPPTTNGWCGPEAGRMTCTDSSFGGCCSIWGLCGSTPANCGHLVCDPGFGTCDPVPEKAPVSQDGVCGFQSFIGATCIGSEFGSCCSSSGKCGSDTAHCSLSNCDPLYGKCGDDADGEEGRAVGRLSTLPAPRSVDGACSSKSDPFGATCAGSGFGDCCSDWGFCGSTRAYCGKGCQSAFGVCADDEEEVDSAGW